ncbi:MAG: oxidoreductase [Chthonomonadales bacterium]|nr:oxidoreductase [Chthonomonadales bacterium]
MGRLRVATVWMGGCSGCHMSFLDMDEFLIDLADLADVVYSPVADPKEYPENVDLCLVEGAVANDEHVELAHTIRERTKIVVAFGDCAVTGNVTAMRNPLGAVEPILQRIYVEAATIHGRIPFEKGIVPELLDRVAPLHEIIPVDAFLPGCPPPAPRIRKMLEKIVAGEPAVLEGDDLKPG